MAGQVTKIVGPMFSGKTQMAMFRASRWLDTGRTVLFVSKTGDARYGETASVSSHSLRGEYSLSGRADAPGFRPGLEVVRVAGLDQIVEPAADFIIIDEGQFFDDLTLHVLRLSRTGRAVLVCGLDYDARCRPFGEMLTLPADEVVTLSAICKVCHEAAHYSRRTTADSATVLVGGAETYTAVCRRHHPDLA